MQVPTNMRKLNIIIGTRGSALALFQAEEVKSKLLASNSELTVEIKTISTRGDEILDIALSKIGDKGIFTQEIEFALLKGEIDIAVHSLKDLPTELSNDFAIGAVLERAEVLDAFVSINHKSLKDFTKNDKIATSSLRRKAGLLHYNSELQIIDIRGNVNTRLRKMEEGYCEGMIMAAAGLERLGLDRYITEILNPAQLLPAVGQGVIAIQIRNNDPEIQKLVEVINHKETWTAILAERAFMRTLQGGCQVPVGCYTTATTDGLSMQGFVASTDGIQYLHETVSGTKLDPEALGSELAQKLIKLGGVAILNKIRKQGNE